MKQIFKYVGARKILSLLGRTTG